MTPQQIKQQIEKAAKNHLEFFGREFTSAHSYIRQKSFEMGAEHVLSSPELYGLVTDNVYKSAVNDRAKFRAALKTCRNKTAELEDDNSRLREALERIIVESEDNEQVTWMYIAENMVELAKQALEGLSNIKTYTRAEVEALMDDAFHVGYNVGENDDTSPSFLTAEKYIKDRLT